jgi:hypothetical protein
LRHSRVPAPSTLTKAKIAMRLEIANRPIIH